MSEIASRGDLVEIVAMVLSMEFGMDNNSILK